MYKKRFAKWGFHKSSRRSAVVKDSCSKTIGKLSSNVEVLQSMPSAPLLPKDDSLMLMVLTSVKTWSASFFDTIHLPDGRATSQDHGIPTESQLRQFKTKEANFAFKLVVDLLDRGDGILAGRMARKAFLLAEDMLTLEGPALVWNLLEMMHYMVTLRHAHLFQLLLGHFIALAGDRMPNAHPLILMLRGLRQLVVINMNTASSPTSSPPSSHPSTHRHEQFLVDPRLVSGTLPILLRQAWLLNAETLLHNFDPRLFPLYFRILWDYCSIPAPYGLVVAAKQWFCQVEDVQAPNAANVGHHAVRLLASTLPQEEKMLESLLAPLTDCSGRGSLPPDYEALRTSSIAAVQEHGQSFFNGTSGSGVDSTISLRMLAVLATAKVIEELPALSEESNANGSVAISVPHFHAGLVACAIRTLIDLEAEKEGSQPVPTFDTVKKIRAVVTLRGYAEGETDPQVVREMWMLQDALVAAGQCEEAWEVEQDAYRRMEKYIEDIPVHSA